MIINKHLVILFITHSIHVHTFHCCFVSLDHIINLNDQICMCIKRHDRPASKPNHKNSVNELLNSAENYCEQCNKGKYLLKQELSI